MINPIDGSLQVYSASPRKSSKVDLTDSTAMQGMNLWGDLFKHISKLPADADERRGFVIFPSPSQPQTYDISAELQAIDLKPSKNSVYMQKSQQMKTAQVSLTAGQHFEFDIYFYRDINLARDQLIISLIKENKTEKYLVELTNLNTHNKGKHSNSKSLQGRLNFHEKEKLTIDIHLPSNISKGWWNLYIVSSIIQNENDTHLDSSDSESVINGIRVM